MSYLFYSLFTPESVTPNITTQYFESMEDEEKHKKAVTIVRDLEDMIFAAKLCKGKGKKIYLIEAVDDLVCAMSASGTVWPNEIMDKYEAYIADARRIIEGLTLMLISDDDENDKDDDMMLEFATASEDEDMRLRLVARWTKNKN